jgi:putative cell wall-binding protein
MADVRVIGDTTWGNIVRTIGAGRVGLAVAISMLASLGLVAPAYAQSEDATLTISGQLLVVTDTGAELAVELGAAPDAPLPDDRTYSVVTDDGQLIALDGEFPATAASGDHFEGSVAIPDAVATDLDVAPGAVVDAGSELGADVVDAVTTVAEPLVVQSSDVTEIPVDSAVASAAHSMDVVIVSGATSAGSVPALTSQVGSYWISQSNNQISSFTQNPTITALSAACPTTSTQNSLWSAAAATFGNTVNAYLAGAGKHLVVILPSACSGSTIGLGSIGNSLHQGGVLFVSNYLDIAPTTLAHEIGHNLTLGHGNLSYCATAAYDEGSGCSTYEYNDMYSIMGYAIEGRGAVLPALPASQRDWLGAFPSADLALQPGQSGNPVQRTTYTLKPISDSSGVRGIRVTDPLTGSIYYVELRSGSGVDAGAFYTEGNRWDLPGYSSAVGTGSGVRVLQLDTSNLPGKGAQSTVLSVVTKSSQPTTAYAALRTGDDFMSRSGGLHIEVVSMAPNSTNPISATVTVTTGGWSGGNPAPAVSRIAGSDRFAVGVSISQQAYPSPAHVPVVYVTTGYNYPDALSAAPVATKFGGPLLLTPSDALPAEVRAEVARLNPAKIVVVGGPGSVSAAVFDTLQLIAPTSRLGGSDRFETSRLIVRNAWLTGGGTGARSAYIATGLNFPDALSASGAGGAFDTPVILVPGTDVTLDRATRQLLIDLGVTSIKVAGGPGAVSPEIMAALNSIAPTTRLAGADRFEASRNIAVDAFASHPPTAAYIATGYNFPDALAGAVLAGTNSAPLIVVPTDCVPAGVIAAFDGWAVTSVTLLGGTGALTPRVEALLPC